MDYAIVNSEIFFSRGSRQGDTSCATVVIINDGTAELPEEIFLNLTSLSQRVAMVDPTLSQLGVSIEDDDGEIL